MENKTFIYTLSDPDTNEIRYVGKSNNPKYRLRKHIELSKQDKNKTHKENWILSLLNKNLKPIIEIIDEVSIDEWEFWEIYWIYQFKTWGFNLTNTTTGGGINNGFKGKNHSEETKEKCRLAGLKSPKIKLFGEQNGRCKLTNNQVEEIKEKVLLGVDREQIATEYKINKKYIYFLISGKRRKQKTT